LNNLIKENKYGEFCLIDGDNYTSDISKYFMNVIASDSYIINANDKHRTSNIANQLCFGKYPLIPDIYNSDFIINFGANPYESNKNLSPFIQRLIDAKMRGTKLITFDVRLSNTASKSDKWIAIKPATDLAVILAMIYHIVTTDDLDEYIDKNFINTWTNIKFIDLKNHIVNSKYDPKWASGISDVPEHVIKMLAEYFIKGKKPVIITGSGVTAHAGGAITLQAAYTLQALKGNINKEGGLCQFVLPEMDNTLKNMLNDKELKKNIPETKKLSIFSDRTTETLYDKPIPENFFTDLKNNKQDKLSMLLTHAYNPAYENFNSTSDIEVLKDELLIPFHVTVSSTMNETVKLADLILPETTYLESYGLHFPNPLSLKPFYQFQQAVVSPMYETKDYIDIIFILARNISTKIKKFFPYKSHGEYLEKMINENPYLKENKVLDKLKTIGSFIDVKQAQYNIHTSKINTGQSVSNYTLPENGVTYDTQKAKTGYYGEGVNDAKAYIAQTIGELKYLGFVPGKYPKTGLVELKLKSLYSDGLYHMPTWTYPNELEAMKTISKVIVTDNTDKLVLVTYSTAFHTNSITENCKSLAELQHANPAYINPQTASKLGIKNGDEIKIISPIGEKKTKCYVYEGVHPDVVAIAKNAGHWEMGRYASGKTIKYPEKLKVHAVNQNVRVWWQNRGIDVNRIIPNIFDDKTFQQRYLDTVVKIEKVL